MSQPRIASSLDLSVRTVIRAYAKLEQVGLLVRRGDSPQDTAVRSSDEWNEYFMPDKADVLLKMKTKNSSIETIQIHNFHSVSGGDNLSGGVVTNCQGGGDKLSHNINKDTNNDTIKTSKDVKKETIPTNKTVWLDFVRISGEEYQKLKTELGQVLLDQYIERLNGWIGSKGDKYKSHYHTILNWVRKDKADGRFVDAKQALVKELALIGNQKFVAKYGRETWEQTPSN